ncbi:HAD hydrolase-like protein [Enterococcus faecium]|nr:HAD hydrolase-like protein [Enterococcus faecium]
MTYKNIVFDLDDTLYDHQLPFKRSVEKCFPTIDIQQIDNIYKRFRYWSDVAFPKYTKKLISIEQLRIFRCQKTMEEFGIDSISRTEALDFQADYEEFGIDSISRTEALDFQADYEYELDQITMIPEIHQLLLALHKNRIPIGILTNGPVDLQSRNSKILVPINILKSKISSLVSPLTEELQKIAMKVM